MNDFSADSSTVCLKDTSVCDGEWNMPSGIDEDECEDWSCLPGYWKCQTSSICIGEIWLCNGRNDCGFFDTSDEENCGNFTPICQNFQTLCNDHTKCILLGQVCDGKRNCNDESDEIGCESWVCARGLWKCENNIRCISEADLCDGFAHCPDGSDEKSKQTEFLLYFSVANIKQFRKLCLWV